MVGYPQASLILAWTGLVASQIHLSTGDYLIVLGAFGFLYSSLRSGRMKVLRDSNNDLVFRNTQLEEEKVKNVATIALLEKRPSLDAQEKLLDRLLTRLESHDMATANAVSASQEVFKEIVAELRIIHEAVVPPEIIRED